MHGGRVPGISVFLHHLLAVGQVNGVFIRLRGLVGIGLHENRLGGGVDVFDRNPDIPGVAHRKSYEIGAVKGEAPGARLRPIQRAGTHVLEVALFQLQMNPAVFAHIREQGPDRRAPAVCIPIPFFGTDAEKQIVHLAVGSVHNRLKGFIIADIKVQFNKVRLGKIFRRQADFVQNIGKIMELRIYLTVAQRGGRLFRVKGDDRVGRRRIGSRGTTDVGHTKH